MRKERIFEIVFAFIIVNIVAVCMAQIGSINLNVVTGMIIISALGVYSTYKSIP